MGNPRGRPFEAGNKLGKGRPKGSQNKATVALQEMLEDSGTSIMAKLKLMALKGDRTAMRLCLERLLPVRKGRPVQFKLSPIKTVADATRAMNAVLQDVSNGLLTPEEGHMLSGMIQAQGQFILAADIVPRLERLEDERAQHPREENDMRPEDQSEPPDRPSNPDLPDRPAG